jgi:hypothetical protein
MSDKSIQPLTFQLQIPLDPPFSKGAAHLPQSQFISPIGKGDRQIYDDLDIPPFGKGGFGLAED